MMLWMIIAVVLACHGQLGCGNHEATDILPTRTPCIATQTFLDELRKMLRTEQDQEASGKRNSPTKSVETDARRDLKHDSNRKEIVVLHSHGSKNVQGKGGAIYTRWGRTECSLNNELVYKGVAGGNPYGTKAGPANILCLPENPEYGNHTPGIQAGSLIHGTEYETSRYNTFSFKNLQDHDVPCAVCRSRTKTSVIMVPAKMSCFPGWQVEYTGLLMGGHSNHAASEYLCVDGDAEKDRSGHEDKNGQLLYLVEGICGSLPCPPYRNLWELTCTVCSK